MSIKRIGLRLNLDKEADRKAWEYLQEAKKSYSKTVIAAINGYYEVQAEEKRQTAFLEQIIKTIEQTIKSTAPVNAVIGLLQILGQQQPISAVTDENQKTESDDTALDFLDSL